MSEKQIDALFQDVILRDAEAQSRILVEERGEAKKDAIPELSQKRFERMLDSELAPQREKKERKSLGRVSRIIQRVIVAAAACIVVMFGLMMTSEAVRARVTAFLVSITPNYAEIGLDNIDELPPSEKTAYWLGYVPEGYVLTWEQHEVGQDERYQKGEEQLFNFHVLSKTGTAQLDTENALKIAYVSVGEETGLLIVQSDWTSLGWSNETTTFILDGTLSEEEIMKIADSVTASAQTEPNA